MLDEFPALGRLDFFESSLAYLGGYGVRAFLIAQSLNQLDKAYGPNHAILDNCHIRVAFATNDERTAKRISDSLGTATEMRAQRNYAGHRLAPWLAHVMVSRQETARPLLTPGEIMQLPSRDEIVMAAGVPPIRAKKLKYYDEENFLERALPAPSAAAGRAGTPPPHDWAPVLTYLFHRLEARFDGRPTLLVLDEAWVFLDDPLFAGRIREWLKVLRKKNVAVVFATQSLADVAESAIAPAVIESCPSRIFLPNPRAQEPQQAEAYARFGLNDRQVEIIARATPKRDYYFQSRQGNRLFDLELGPVALAFCAASSPEDQREVARVLREAGRDGFAAAWLRARSCGRAAEIMEAQFRHTPQYRDDIACAAA